MLGAALIVCALVVGIAGYASAGGGFDRSFSGDGKRTTDFGGDEDLFAVDTLGNRTIVVAGYSDDAGDNDFAVSRYRRGGGADKSFSSDGHALIGFGGDDQARDVAIQRNGRVVVVGLTDQGGSDRGVAVARLRPGGAPDQSFSGDGKRVYDFGGSVEGTAVAIQRDGKIVVAVRALTGATPDFMVLRLKRGGAPDSTFGGVADGVAQTDFGGTDRARSLALQRDGKILVAGISDASGTDDFAVARYRRGGGLDSKFSGDGRRLLDLGGDEAATAVATAPGKRIALAGISGVGSGDWAVARLRPGGADDKSFSQDGAKVTEPGGSGDSLLAVAVREGRLVVAGETNRSGNRRFAIARYRRKGALDDGFSGDGIKTFTVRAGASNEGARDMAIQPDGRIVAAGFTFDGAGDQALVKLRP